VIPTSLFLLACSGQGPGSPPDSTDTGDTGDTQATDTGDAPRTCPDTPWVQLSASAEITCGTHVDGCVECWGRPGFGAEYDGCLSGDTACESFENFHEDQVEVSHAAMVAVAPLTVAGPTYTTTRVCALDEQGTVTCWGRQWKGPMVPWSRPDVSSIAASVEAVCGLLGPGGAESTVECWDPTDGNPVELVPARGARDIRASNGSICWTAATEGGCYLVWRYPDTPDDAFQTLDVAGDGTAVDIERTMLTDVCIVSDQGVVRCVDYTGRDLEAGYWPYPEGGHAISELCYPSANDHHGCALTDAGAPFCWGGWPERAFDTTQAAALDVPLHGLTCGMYHACAVTEAGEAVCWGDNSAGQATPPGGYVLARGTQALWH